MAVIGFSDLASLVRSAMGIYLLLGLLALAAALMRPKGWLRKTFWTLLVLVVFAYLPIRLEMHSREIKAKREKEAQVAQAILAPGIALFNAHCANAGEKVYRTVDDVDGVVWMKWHPESAGYKNNGNQYEFNDPYGQDCGGEYCIKKLLRVTGGQALNPELSTTFSTGYAYAEAQDPSDGKLYRYRRVIKLRDIWTKEALERQLKRSGKGISPNFYDTGLEKEEISAFSARYGITWDDLSTKEDRDHWIAGGSLKVIDLKTDEVIAERVGYMMDVGQGKYTHFRSPWHDAQSHACPSYTDRGLNFERTRNFVLSVLKPTSGERPPDH